MSLSLPVDDLHQLGAAARLLMAVHLLKAGPIREPVWEQLHGQRVRVYRNLHNGLFSVLHRGRVVAHVPEVHLNDARFVVNEAGRQRVIKEQKKNVHAFVDGTVDHNPERGVQALPTGVTYNPYRFSSFVRAHDSSPIQKAKAVTLRLVDGMVPHPKLKGPDGKAQMVPGKKAVMTAEEHPEGGAVAADHHQHGLPGV